MSLEDTPRPGDASGRADEGAGRKSRRSRRGGRRHKKGQPQEQGTQKTSAGPAAKRPEGSGARRPPPTVRPKPPADRPPPPRGYMAALLDEDDDFDDLHFLDDEPDTAETTAEKEPRKRRRRRKKSSRPQTPPPASAAVPAEPQPKPKPERKTEPPRAQQKPPVREKQRLPETVERPVREKQRPPATAERPVREKQRLPEVAGPPKPRETRREPPRTPAPERKAAEDRPARPPRQRERAEVRPAEKPATPPRAIEKTPPPASTPAELPSTPPRAAEKKAPAPPPTAEKKPPRRREATGGFTTMGLSDAMLDALEAAEYLEPTPVQAGLIPRAMAGVDVMGQARTGTGKTAAFAIPILERLDPNRPGAPPQALALVPTRELAVQVRDECNKLAEGRDVHVRAIYGGKPIRQQAEHLRRGAAMIVGTPGRVIDMMNRGLLRLDQIRIVVLDEADRMLDIGFRPDIEKILRRCPSDRQTLLLSATIPPPVKRLAERYMREPESLDFSAGDVAVETIEQFYFTVDPERKFDLLVKLLEREKPAQAIVFTRTRRGADKLHQKLDPLFDNVDAIHGDLAQSARDRVMRHFRDGITKVLVATDVVGRGIDVTGISHIINFDVPAFSDDYVHRVGRTGRMGREGVAYTFVSPEEGNELTRIEMRINRLLQRDEIPGFVALEKPQATEDFDPETGEPLEPPAPKPVFGKMSRRYRRAL